MNDIDSFWYCFEKKLTVGQIENINDASTYLVIRIDGHFV